MCGPVYRPPAGAATGAQYGLLGPHEQSHQRERLICLPKGESMKKKTQHNATLAQHFINGYPREMFDGKSSGELFRDELQKLNLSNPEKVYSFFNLAV